ncbi:MAG: hypothetical protein K6F50_02615 [Kiritimatiellae bacterium]|nr:hypothetical protein [Kiritimatiellia bacterium]
MTDRGVLRKICRERQDEAIVALLAERMHWPYDKAIDVYYRSKLSSQMAEGKYGIDNLSPSYLVEDLIENEPELFACVHESPPEN